MGVISTDQDYSENTAAFIFDRSGIEIITEPGGYEYQMSSDVFPVMDWKITVWQC